jgi:hypothetical protein
VPFGVGEIVLVAVLAFVAFGPRRRGERPGGTARTLARAGAVIAPALLVVDVAGCGSSSNNTSSDPGPLVGSWFAQITPITSDNQTETITFKANFTYTGVHTQVDSATAQSKAGCTETTTDNGTFSLGSSGGMSTVTLAATPATSGMSVFTNCASGADNGTGTGSVLTTGTWVYSISGTTLTATINGSSSPTTFTKK